MCQIVGAHRRPNEPQEVFAAVAFEARHAHHGGPGGLADGAQGVAPLGLGELVDLGDGHDEIAVDVLEPVDELPLVVGERRLLSPEQWDEIFSFENLISPQSE